MSQDLRLPNVVCAHYYLARAEIRCWHCLGTTRVLALAVPPGHQVLELADRPSGTDGPWASDMWQRSDFNAFLFHVRRFPASVRRRTLGVAPGFRLARDASTFESYWANHCEQCAAMLGDHEIHCEPDIAFVMTSEQQARRVRVLRIGERLEAAADGYAPEPQFFDLMTIG